MIQVKLEKKTMTANDLAKLRFNAVQVLLAKVFLVFDA